MHYGNLRVHGGSLTVDSRDNLIYMLSLRCSKFRTGINNTVAGQVSPIDGLHPRHPSNVHLAQVLL